MAGAPIGEFVLRPLLLATEHTEQDRGAERVAFALAHSAGVAAAATALDVVMPLLSNPEFEAVAPEMAARADADLARRREALVAAAAAEGVSLAVQVRRGSEPHAEIVAAAEELRAALLVTRRRGQRGLLANLLIGEMVSKVLAQAPCSMLVVPHEALAWRSGVLVGVDLQHRCDALVVAASALARGAGAPLHLVCVAARDDDRQAAADALARAQAAVQAVAGRVPVPVASAEVRVGAAHGEIIAAAGERGADLIAVARQGGSRLGRARVGGTAQKVIGLAPCAVFVHVEAAPPAARRSAPA